MVAGNVEEEISRYLSQTAVKAVQVEVHPSVAAVLEASNRQRLVRLEENFNKKIVIKSSGNIKYEDVKIKEIDSDSLVC
jgi:ribonuclease G